MSGAVLVSGICLLGRGARAKVTEEMSIGEGIILGICLLLLVLLWFTINKDE